MTNPSALILQQTGLKTSHFSPTSRYYGIDTAAIESAQQGTLVYLRRRFVPPPERFHTLLEHLVTEGERPDTVTSQYLGDPEQFWRICDANGVMQPDELTQTIGRRIRITLPEGIAGF